ncbi:MULTISPECIES: hypothetical protein [Ralstonia]|uniref:Peptidase M41 domain-containing protein n=2 Tax=Ralstonia TaxID=48736 RepID=A0AAD2BZ29_9RALS|nr:MULTISPECIES: hypothetical protein [Ralstonia]NMV39934.1 hypothetical protein [Ralstonia insidiosa]CAJ0807579.1 hypothetical protein R77560_04595 [Ralstonia sp. LMG 18095]
MKASRSWGSQWQQALEELRQAGPKPLALGALRFMLAHPLLVLGIVAVMVLDASVPAVGTLPPLAQVIYNATNIVGALGVVWWVARMVALVLETGLIDAIGDAALGIFERVVLLGLALIGVRAFGVELADFVASVKSNPDLALACVAAVIVMRFAFWFAPARGIPIACGSSSAHAVLRRPRRPQDIHRTAVHEAGHLILHGGQVDLPPGLAVAVSAEMGDHDLYRGYVNHSAAAPSVRTEGHLHWSMLMYLAGTEAERIVLGERADGSCGDNDKWLDAARAYLSTGFGEVFYADPTEDAALAHNRAVLNDLKEKCTLEVRTILMANRALLEELAAVIADQKTLNREQLAPYLERVVGVDARWHEGEITPAQVGLASA